MSVNIERVRTVLLDICEDLGVSVDRIVVYGSLASGDFGDGSDIDVMVVSEDFEGIDFYKRGSDITFEWRDYDLPELDVVPLTPDEYEKGKEEGSWLIEEVEETGKEIYA